VFVTDTQLIRYFRKHRSDPGLARAGVIWLGGLTACHVAVSNYINLRLITMSVQFTSGFMMDFVSLGPPSSRHTLIAFWILPDLS
jgi:hypothetical protein